MEVLQVRTGWVLFLMTNSQKLSDLRKEFIGLIEEGWGRKGAESVKGRIIAIIYLSPTELTQAEIAKSIINETTQKHYSRSQISRHLKELTKAGIIARRSKPGTKIQLYRGREASTFDNFQLWLIERQRFFLETVNIMDHLIKEWNTLPDTSKDSEEGKKFKDVVSSYNEVTHITLDIIDDYVKRFDERMKALHNKL